MTVYLLRPRERLRSSDECVCLSDRISPEPHARSLVLYQFFLYMLPMSVARSFSGMLTIGRIAYRREGVTPLGTAQRGRSVISYDCLVHVWIVFYGRPIGQAVIFLACGFFLFFLAWSQRPQIGCLRYFYTWCGPSVNLECRSEMCCTRLAGNTEHNIAILAPSHKFVGLYLWN